MNRRLIGACLAAVSLTATGCAQRIDGHAIALDPPKPALVVNTMPVDFDPCIDISDSTLRSSGLNPSTEFVADDEDSLGCEWTAYSSLYDLGIYAYDFPIADADESDIVIERRTTVGGRPAVVFIPLGATDSGCAVAFDGAAGSVVVYLWPDGERPTATSCEVALMHAAELVDDVPA